MGMVYSAVGQDGPCPASPVDLEEALDEFNVARDGDLLLLPLTFDGKTYLFAVDTGADITALDLSLVPSSENPR